MQQKHFQKGVWSKYFQFTSYVCQKNRHKNLKLRSNKDHQRNTFPSWRWICSRGMEACTCRKNHLKPFAEVITTKRQCSAHQRQFFISNPAQMPSPAIKLGSQFIWFSFCPFHCVFGWAGFTFPSLVASNYTSQFLRGKNRNERSDTSLITESCTPAYKWPVAHAHQLLDPIVHKTRVLPIQLPSARMPFGNILRQNWPLCNAAKPVLLKTF